MGSLGGREIRN